MRIAAKNLNLFLNQITSDLEKETKLKSPFIEHVTQSKIEESNGIDLAFKILFFCYNH